MKRCCVCNNELSKDDVALCKKLLGKNIRQFFCREDLADVLEVEVTSLNDKVEQYKEEGCTLFV